MKPEQKLSSFEPIRDENGDAVLQAVNYPFRCVKISLTDGDKPLCDVGIARSHQFVIEAACGCAGSIDPLLVRKVEIGYPPLPYPPITLEAFMDVSVVLTLDYGLSSIVSLPPEASIDKDGRLCWALTDVPPMVRVWSYVPLVIASTECLGAWPRSPDDPDELLIL